jgi:hypothetical protein
MRVIGCWQRYRNGFAEIVHIISEAETASSSLLPGGAVSEQQVLVRAAIILLSSHLEAFFSQLADDFLDAISDKSFQNQPKSVQRYLALQAAEGYAKAIESLGDAYAEQERTNFYKRSMQVSRWLKSPTRISESSRPRLREFYRQRGVKSIDKYLSLYSSGPVKFFDWLGSKGHDRSRFAVVVDGLVTARNEIAHGNNSGTSLGIQDIRDYLAVVTVMLRHVRTYVED